ncbi:MAG: hypothetical protein PVH68_01620 [Armatimonadota bacterium]|jgi:hypothetical protein
MDELARYNRERWEELAQAGIAYSRPALDLDADSARAMVDAEGMMGAATGRGVLCLAGGGDVKADPGTWQHFEAIAPPWLTFWATLEKR